MLMFYYLDSHKIFYRSLFFSITNFKIGLLMYLLLMYFKLYEEVNVFFDDVTRRIH